MVPPNNDSLNAYKRSASDKQRDAGMTAFYEAFAHQRSLTENNVIAVEASLSHNLFQF
jgi:hypothetical protein